MTTGSGTYSKYGAAFKCEYTGSQQCSLISIDYSGEYNHFFSLWFIVINDDASGMVRMYVLL